MNQVSSKTLALSSPTAFHSGESIAASNAALSVNQAHEYPSKYVESSL